MPGVLPTLSGDGTVPALWTALIQQINGVARLASGTSTNPTRYSLDEYQNCTAIQGSLNQVVTVGASFQQPGVLVGTGLSGFGVAVPSAFFATTCTIASSGSVVVTVASSAGLVNGMQFGAVAGPAGSSVQIFPPGNGVPSSGTTNVIGVAGFTVSLSQPAVLPLEFVGVSIPCFAVSWTQTNVDVHP